MLWVRQIPLVCSFLISLGVIGFAITIYHTDHATAMAIIAVVGGHWLGVGSVATGRSLTDLYKGKINGDNQE